MWDLSTEIFMLRIMVVQFFYAGKTPTDFSGGYTRPKTYIVYAYFCFVFKLYTCRTLTGFSHASFLCSICCTPNQPHNFACHSILPPKYRGRSGILPSLL